MRDQEKQLVIFFMALMAKLSLVIWVPGKSGSHMGQRATRDVEVTRARFPRTFSNCRTWTVTNFRTSWSSKNERKLASRQTTRRAWMTKSTLYVISALWTVALAPVRTCPAHYARDFWPQLCFLFDVNCYPRRKLFFSRNFQSIHLRSW